MTGHNPTLHGFSLCLSGMVPLTGSSESWVKERCVRPEAVPLLSHFSTSPWNLQFLSQSLTHPPAWRHDRKLTNDRTILWTKHKFNILYVIARAANISLAALLNCVASFYAGAVLSDVMQIPEVILTFFQVMAMVVS